MSEIMKTVVVDDEQLSLNGMASLASSIENFEVTGTFSDANSALEYIVNNDVDILLTDIKMPNHDGLWLINQIEKLNIYITIIIVSAYDDKEYLFKAIKSPLVFDYITKPFLKEELVELLNTAATYHVNNTFISTNLNVNSVISLVRSNQYDDAINQFNEYFAHTKHSLHALKNRFYGYLMNIQNNLFGTLMQRSDDYFTKVLQSIYEANTVDELKNVITKYIKYCCNNINKQSTVTAIVSASLKIINSQLDDPDLNLNNVALQLNVTPNYLSNRFSRDMKQSFSNYLTSLRIDKAKHLLKSLDLKVYEVACQVGFIDVAYFSRVFKENTSLTPLQYRQKSINKIEEEDNE